MICIRRCERADLDALERAGFAERPLIAATFARVERSGAEMLVAEADTIVGQVWIDFECAPDCAKLWALRVTPAWQCRGIATALLETAEQLVAACALRWTIVEVDRENVRARQLFERVGYAFAWAREEDCLVLRKRIMHPREDSQPLY